MKIAIPAYDHSNTDGYLWKQREAIIQALKEAGVEPYEGKFTGEKRTLLSEMYDQLIGGVGGYVFTGPLTKDILFLIVQTADQLQTGIADAFLRDESGKIIEKDGLGRLKPFVILNHKYEDGTSTKNLLQNLFTQLKNNGLLRKDPEEYLVFIEDPKQLTTTVTGYDKTGGTVHNIRAHKEDIAPGPIAEPRSGNKPAIFIGMSWGTTNEYFVEIAKQMDLLAQEGYDFVTGGDGYRVVDGKNLGMMGNVAEAGKRGGAYVTGSIYPEMSIAGGPKFDNRVLLKGNNITIRTAKNIGDRLEILLGQQPEKVQVDGAVALPGGLGTVGEIVAGILMGHSMPLLNALNPETGERVFDSTIALLEHAGFKRNKDFSVITPPLITKEGMEVSEYSGDMSGIDIKASATLAVTQLTQEINRLRISGKLGPKWEVQR
jgi:predicted Rossmann-fold nucleotide-binding protein